MQKKNNWPLIFSMLFGALMVALCWGFFGGNNETAPHSDQVEKQVTRAYDSLKAYNAVLLQRIDDNKKIYDSALQAASNTRVEIIHEYRKQNETIRIIRNFNSTQLLQFWATIKPDTAYSGTGY